MQAKEDAPNRTDVTYTYLQQEEKTGTAEKQVDIRTETLELHCPSEAFTDLDTNQWYHEGVDYVLEQELMIGMSNTQFAPNGTMTRGQLMTVLHRMAGEPETKGQSPFADVKAGKYYTEPIAWAFETGIAKGMTAHCLCPQRACHPGADGHLPGPVCTAAGRGYGQQRGAGFHGRWQRQ